MMSRKRPTRPIYTAPKATMDEVIAMQSRMNQMGVDFLQIDVDAALTFCAIARRSHDLKRKVRNRQHARQGYDTILRLVSQLSLTSEQMEVLKTNMQRLKSELMELGEAFQADGNGLDAGQENSIA